MLLSNKMVNKKNFVLVIIFILHLLLLKWILFALNEGGLMPFKTVLMHFTGMAAFGAGLIRFCAWYFNREYQKELLIHGKK